MNFRIRPFHIGILASLVAAALVIFIPEDWLDEGRELYFDRLTQLFPLGDAPDIAVVDIDRKAYQSVKDQNWQRTETAELIDKIASGKPAVLAFDLVFSTNCSETDVENEALAAALSHAPAVLGFLLSETPSASPKPIPQLAIVKSLTVPDLWYSDGAEAACPIFQKVATATAGSFLIGDEDARVRRIQAYSIVGENPYPALGLEAARELNKVRTPILGGTPPWLKLGRRGYSLAEDGSLRFVASTDKAIIARTVSAADVMSGKVAASFFAGKAVFIGSSLPNLGGLRSSAANPLEASVQIHADLANSILKNFVPMRADDFVDGEAGVTLLLGLMIALMTARFRPMVIAASGVAIIALSLALSAGIYAVTAWLTDGFTVALMLGLVLVVTAFAQFAESRRAERVARQRFAQYLPQSVVSRYIDNPSRARMAGEERQVTALFTDIESFSTLAGQVSPRALIALLDVYFAEVTALIARRGGMVDKIVGDAVHAFFNAPEDLVDHVDITIRCALDISRLTEAMRRRPEFAAVGFGRTRLGIETGTAVLGEVGAGGKLDYTAHGNAINLAARLQDANKFLGTTICVGPDATRESKLTLRPLGAHEIRGFGTMPLFTADDLVAQGVDPI